MKKNWLIMACGLLLAAAAVMMAHYRAASPLLAVYQGKTAQQWISWYGPLTNYASPGNTDYAEFSAAMKAMGTNALPAIVEAFGYQDSAWSRTYSNLYPKLPAFLKQSHPRPKSVAVQMHHAANVAFLSLEVSGHSGTNVFDLVNREELRTALPDFMKILAEKNHSGHFTLLFSIYRLFGPGDTNCVPTLIQCYSETDKNIPPAAFRCIRNIGPETVTPECLKLLNGPDEALQLNAAELLGRFGNAPTTAIPALEHAIETGNPALREQALKSLKRIDPDAAAKYETTGTPASSP